MYDGIEAYGMYQQNEIVVTGDVLTYTIIRDVMPGIVICEEASTSRT